ncbi:MAG TPA: hypothetical protein PLD25_07125 [Chloroflexota bacterium]|nr:hypothetical protein [Chloroflexota bacterium]HUM71246.1 hypothetical protein [Chloroflexota bacterium]
MEKGAIEKVQNKRGELCQRISASANRYGRVCICLFLFLLLTGCQAGPEKVADVTSPVAETPILPTATIETALSPSATAPRAQETMTPDFSWKIASSVQQRLTAISQAMASGTADVSGLSDNLLRIRPGGEMALVFHAAGTVGQAEEADLVALGAEIVTSTADLTWPEGMPPPPGLGQIQAWLLYDRVEDAARLPWVTAVTPPNYGVSD